MRIAIDVSSAAKPNPTGIARYQIELVRAAGPQLASDDRLMLTVRLNRWTRRKYLKALFDVRGVEKPRWLVPKVDIFHAGGIASPRRASGLKVVSVFDTATIDTPEFSTPTFGESYSRNMRNALAHSDLVIAISGFVRDRILQLFPNLEPRRVVTVSLGADHAGLSEIAEPRDREVLERLRLDRHRFILFVGRVERRKNPEGLVRAFARTAAASEHILVFAGPGGESDVMSAVDAACVNERVRFLGRVDDSDLGPLYRGADLFALPSHYEGFGIPLLEAMACGTPSLAGNRTAMPEVAGDAALLVDAKSVAAIADGIERLIVDRHLREELKTRGRVQASKFRWRRCARETLDAYRYALELGPRR
ncbi:MAG TPA: glycosyltransferase family 1 protein [Candidatus Binataceae bacterium]